MLKKIIILFICTNLFRLEGVFAQINLVANPSFEDLKHCPTGGGQIDSTIAWNTPKNGGGGNPEVFNACSSSNICGVPLNTFYQSYQWPHSGNGYAGIDVAISSNPDNFREYIQSKMLNKLKGGAYCVTFYVSLDNPSKAFIKPLGAYLDSGNVSAPAPHGIAAVTPQVYNTLQQLSDTLNWMKVEGSFVAAGIETYITIGNFFTDADSDIGFWGVPSGWSSYYYIDDVSVIDVSTLAHAGNDTTIIPGDSVFIGRTPEVGLNEDCIWFVNNQPIDTVAGMWVKPTITTTYVLQQSICGTVTYDSVKINISGVGVNELNNNEGLEIYPNPVKDELIVDSKYLIGKEASITIYDVLGNKVIQLKNRNVSQSIDVRGLKEGVYFIDINNVTKRFVVLK